MRSSKSCSGRSGVVASEEGKDDEPEEDTMA